MLVWRRSIFVFTGKFAFGPRAECQRQAVARGGLCEENVTQRTTYLIIGTFGSRDWVHTPFGRKIEKAVKYREAGLGVAIVAEEHWAGCLAAPPVLLTVRRPFSDITERRRLTVGTIRLPRSRALHRARRCAQGRPTDWPTSCRLEAWDENSC